MENAFAQSTTVLCWLKTQKYSYCLPFSLTGNAYVRMTSDKMEWEKGDDCLFLFSDENDKQFWSKNIRSSCISKRFRLYRLMKVKQTLFRSHYKHTDIHTPHALIESHWIFSSCRWCQIRIFIFSFNVIVFSFCRHCRTVSEWQWMKVALILNNSVIGWVLNGTRLRGVHDFHFYSTKNVNIFCSVCVRLTTNPKIKR